MSFELRMHHKAFGVLAPPCLNPLVALTALPKSKHLPAGLRDGATGEGRE